MINLNNYLAKEDESILEHTNNLITSLKSLHELGYLKDVRLLSLIERACYYHDFGKANREFQKRIKLKSKFNERVEIAHNILSLFFINKDVFEDKDDYYRVAHAVLNHHNYCDNYKALEEKEKIENLLSDFDTYSIGRRVINKIIDIVDDNKAILTKGFLHKCDYAASSHIQIEIKNDFLNDNLQNLGYEWNELQEFMIKNREKNTIAIAQTGMGKTEAGLLWIGNNKGFFILPLRTAINAIYERIKNNVLKNNDIDNKLALLHSETFNEYIDEKSKNTELDIFEYYNKTRQLSIPLTISTLDQIFNMVFKYDGYELKLATLSYSKIVIDEIQMYSPDLLAYLIYGLKMINDFGGKFSILTATLPPFIKDILKEHNIEFEYAEYTNELERHSLRVIEQKLNSAFILEKYNSNKTNKSNKILVVCNTVKKTQKLYDELTNSGIENLNLLHSKFIKKDRNKKEKQILKFGGTDFDGDGVWIATQLVEASLDIDFDVLITELSDINGLFQRLGRCNRKGRKSVKDYNCFVFTEIDKKNFLFIDKEIYDLSIIAIKNIDGLLKEKEKLKLVQNTMTLENIDGTGYLNKYNDYFDKISKLYSYEKSKAQVNKEFRNIISYDVIPESIFKRYKRFIKKCLETLNTKINDDKEKEILKLKKAKAKRKIKELILSIPIYEYEKAYKYGFIDKNGIELDNYTMIPIIKYDYTFERGLLPPTKEELQSSNLL